MEPLILVLILVVAVGMTAAVVVRSRRSRTAEPDLAPTRPPRAPQQPPTPVAEPEVETAEPAVEEAEPTAPVAEPAERVKPRLRDRLGKTRAAFAGAFSGIAGRGKVDDETWDDLEEALILADVGVPTTTKVIDAVRERARTEKTGDPERVLALLREELVELLRDADRELRFGDATPSVWMFVGVNGVGKTT